MFRRNDDDYDLIGNNSDSTMNFGSNINILNRDKDNENIGSEDVYLILEPFDNK